MAVEFQCEHCDALLSAEAEAGAEVECPHCGQASVVPEGLAALPSPQVPGQSPPPVPTDQAAAEAPADDPPPEATDENGEPLDEDEEDEEHHEPSAMMKWLSDSVPWLISLFVNLAVVLILIFIPLLVIYGKPEDVPVPDVVQSEQPGGSISPADMATSDRSRTVRPTPTRKFSKKESPTVDSGKTSDAVELIGVGAGGSTGGSPTGLTGGGGGGPSGFLGLGGNVHHVVWLIDRSGSIGTNFDILRLEMLASISRLRPVQDFHIIMFAEGPPLEKVPKRLTPANKRHKVEAADFLDGIKTAEGSTDPVPALTRAFEVLKAADPKKGGKLIYLLTDGVFPDNEKVIRTVNEMNKTRSVLLNTFLYSTQPDPLAEKVLQQLAKENGGRYKYVSPDEVYD